MNKKTTLILVIFLVSIFTNAKEVVLPDGTKANIDNLQNYQNGNFKKADLLEPVIIKTPLGNFKFSYFISYYESGKFYYGCLTDNNDINTSLGKVSAANTIGFYENGNLNYFYFSTPKEIDCSIGKPKARRVDFLDNGKISVIYLSEKISINTALGFIDFFNSKYEAQPIYFSKNGNFLGGSLSKTTDINTNYGKLKCEEVFFYENGKLLKIRSIDNGYEINILNIILKYSEISFYESGKIKNIQLFTNVKIGKTQYNKSDLITFSENGKIIDK